MNRMDKLRKIMFVFFTAALIAAASFSVHANGPGIPRSMSILFTDVPENIAFADLLFEADEKKANYSQINTGNLEENKLSPEAEIVKYRENGFESYTFHYNGAKSKINLERMGKSYDGSHEESYVHFFIGLSWDDYQAQYEDLRKNHKAVKIAFLDEAGDVLSVSEEFILPKISAESFLMGIEYNYPTGEVEPDIYTSPYAAILKLFLICVSVLIELFIANKFGFRNGQQIIEIALVNFATQGLMIFMYGYLPFSYAVSTVILEILVYTSEFFVFDKTIMKEEETAKVLRYTIVANTASLIVGLYLLWAMKFI